MVSNILAPAAPLDSVPRSRHAMLAEHGVLLFCTTPDPVPSIPLRLVPLRQHGVPQKALPVVAAFCALL